MAVAGPILIAVGAIIAAVAIGVKIYQAAEKEAKKAEA
jgi:hypothetical protein